MSSAIQSSQLTSAQRRRVLEPASYRVNVPPRAQGQLEVRVRLRYRKVDQYLLNFIFGEKAGLTAPITDMDWQTRRIEIVP